ncbi:MAG: rod shape-determining protein RodA [Actinomycetota bacterium]|nr:rod shape-determining protein RodA [Actinomycetota bacterium]
MTNFSIVQSRRRIVKESLMHFDYSLMIVTIGLAMVGVLMVYSATKGLLTSKGLNPKYYLERQALWVVLGTVAMFVTIFVDYRHIRRLAYVIYGGVVLGLVGVLSPFGHSALGAQRWFQLGPLQLQPSEFATLAILIMVAFYLGDEEGYLSLKKLGGVLVLAGLPMALVVKQPDIGTAIIIGIVLLSQLVVSRIKLSHLLVLVLFGVLGIYAVIKLHILQKYQLDRLTSFLNTKSNSSTTGYNLAQSKIAIGAGGVYGKGLFHGTQTNLSYVPEQQTDFIFTALGEQFGFVGGSIVIAAFGYVCWRVWHVVSIARDKTGRVLGAGVLSLLAFSIFQNVAMTMGIMPITGIPLPFMSYGGSAALSFFTAVGIALGIGFRNARYLPEDKRALQMMRRE